MATNAPRRENQVVYAYGYWSAIIATILVIAFTFLAVLFPPAAWQGIEAYHASFHFNQMYNFIPVFLLTPVIVILMICLHSYAQNGKKFFTLLGVAFSIVYAVIISMNYYIQLFVVRLNLLRGETGGLSLWAMPNLNSLFFAFEALGYFFMGLATLFAAAVFTGGKLEKWLKGLFITNGLFGITGAVTSLFDQPYIIFAALGLWCILFPLSTILLAVFFKRVRHHSGFNVYGGQKCWFGQDSPSL